MDWDTEISGTYTYSGTRGGPYKFYDRPMRDIITDVCGQNITSPAQFFITEPVKCYFSVCGGKILGPFKE